MRDVILNQSDQITHALDVNKDVKIAGNFDSIILAGLGGSGHPGDLLNALAIPTLPLYVHRNYNLPLEYITQLGFKKPLVITSSYSGNTEETLTAYQQAQNNNLSVLVSAAGGKLKELSAKNNNPFCLIDNPGMQPRHTLFAAFTGIYTALKNSGLAKDITDDLLRTVDILKTKTPDSEEPAKKLADKLKDKVPVFTSSDNLGFAAKNFKIQTNENAKYPAFWNTFPELNHNELVGMSKLDATNNPNKFHVVMIRDKNDHPRVKTRIDVTKDLYKKWGAEVSEFSVEGETLLEKIFHAVTFGLWTTMFLAESYNIDPVPVEGVEDFKKKLEEIAGKT